MADVIPNLAEAVEARRRELRLSPGEFAERSGLTRQGLGRVRKGEDREYQDSTINGVATALQWDADWLDRIRAGKKPRAAAAAKVARAVTDPDEVTQLRGEIAELRETVSGLEDVIRERLLAYEAQLQNADSSTPLEPPEDAAEQR